MEGALEPDHRVTAGEGARELDRVLDRLGAGVEERRLDRPAERRRASRRSDERRVDLVRHDREVGVAELLELLLAPPATTCGCEWPTFRQPTPPAKSMKVFPSRSVIVAPRAVGGDDREGDRERRGDARRQAVQHLARAGAWNLGLQDDRAGGGHGPRVAEEDTHPAWLNS